MDCLGGEPLGGAVDLVPAIETTRTKWPPLALDHEGGDAYTSCCLMATARDWTRIGQLMLNRGTVNGNRIVQPEWITAMTTPSPVSSLYGLQTWLTNDEVNPRGENPATG